MKSNKGMTLVELIIAIAMLAMVITAIAGLMSSNTLTFKKQKSDVFVQNTAQETYNRLSDMIMQASEVEVDGWIVTGGSVAIKEVAGSKTVTIKKGKYDSEDDADKPEYYFQAYKSKTATNADEIYTNVFVKEMRIKFSVPLEKGGIPPALLGSLQTNHPEFFEGTKIKPGITDTCTATISFEENVMKYKLSYEYMSKYDTKDTDPDNLVFTDCINFITIGSEAIPGVRVQLDAENDAIGLEMHFAQKMKNSKKSDGSYPATGMEYNSDGMIKIRNSYVLMDAK